MDFFPRKLLRKAFPKELLPNSTCHFNYTTSPTSFPSPTLSIPTSSISHTSSVHIHLHQRHPSTYPLRILMSSAKEFLHRRSYTGVLTQRSLHRSCYTGVSHRSCYTGPTNSYLPSSSESLLQAAGAAKNRLAKRDPLGEMRV